MAKTIWKYPFPIEDSFELQLPRGARVLSVQTQKGTPTLWAEVFSEAPMEQRDFVVRGTGHPMNGVEGLFIGTFQMRNGTLVWHLYERLKGV